MNVIGDGDHKYGTKTCLKPPVLRMLRIQCENLIASPASSFDKSVTWHVKASTLSNLLWTFGLQGLPMGYTKSLRWFTYSGLRGLFLSWPDWTQNWTNIQLSYVIISYPETSFKIEPTKWEHDDRLLLDLRWEIQTSKKNMSGMTITASGSSSKVGLGSQQPSGLQKMVDLRS